MPSELPLLLLLAVVQTLLVWIPTTWIQPYCRQFRSLVTSLAGAQCLLGMWGLASCLAGSGAAELAILNQLTFLRDGTAALMFSLVSFIGWIACRYSIRYLDGEPMQGRYFQWMSFTLGSVGGMVLAADLLTFGLLWCAISVGLHHLLLHYAERPAAQRAAWTKFSVSRLGDIAIVVSLCSYYSVLQSWRFADLAAAASDPLISSQPVFQLATCALVLGILAKSAQIPFHTWLPLTMETPTPVSALMHAGIVNAGGYLLVRTSPLVNSSLIALSLLVVMGTLTACVASVIMLTQTSVKKKLAYSTIAQMGFMLMQCGLGAYSAAMLHIVAHSLYKAYEFLSSGSVISGRAATQAARSFIQPVRWTTVLLVMLGLMATTWAMLIVVGQNPLTKPGGWLLSGVLCLALTSWISQTLAVGQPVIVLRASCMALVLIGSYSLSFALIDHLVSPPVGLVSWSALSVFVLVAFLSLFVFQIALMSPAVAHRLRSVQLHAANGFYLESWLRTQFSVLKS